MDIGEKWTVYYPPAYAFIFEIASVLEIVLVSFGFEETPILAWIKDKFSYPTFPF